MSGHEALQGITVRWDCVDAIISSYNDAATIIQRVKANRANKQAPAPSRYLEETIQCAPEEISKEKERGLGRFGLVFQQGDETALKHLNAVTRALKTDLLQELQRLADCEEFADFRNLVDAADCARDQTIDTLIRLRQRCLAAENVADSSRHSSDASISPTQPAKEQVRPSLAPTKTYGFPQQHNPWLRLHHRTQSTAKVDSRDASGEEDTHSGAETPKKHGHHVGPLRHFLKHHRAHSHGEKVPEAPGAAGNSKSLPQPVTAQLGDNLLQLNRSATLSAAQDPNAPWWMNDNDTPALVPSLHRLSVDDSHRDSQASFDTIVGLDTASGRSRAASVATSLVRSSSLAVPTPTQENDYLGFCKCAVRMQNGDRKAFERRKEFNDGWSQATVYYLACASNKCAFAGHMDTNIIMTKVFTAEDKGVQFRWPFLAKSHIMQSRLKDNFYAFRCPFCVFSGDKSEVHYGIDAYIDHVSSHRGDIGAVVLYKTKCINDRVAHPTEDFDVNLYPLSATGSRSRRASEMLTDDLKALNASPYGTGKNDSVLAAEEPWNEGLSDFHYRDEFERSGWT